MCDNMVSVTEYKCTNCGLKFYDDGRCFYYDEEEIQDTHKFIDENSTTIRLKLGLTYSIHIIPDGMDITDWCKDSLILDKELFEKLENWNDSDIQF